MLEYVTVNRMSTIWSNYLLLNERIFIIKVLFVSLLLTFVSNNSRMLITINCVYNMNAAKDWDNNYCEGQYLSTYL